MSVLDQPDKIGQLDRQGMLATAARLPDQLAEAVELCRGVKLKPAGKARQIVVCGMGGSAIAGNIAADVLFDSLPVPLSVNRGYRLPASTDKETLLFAVSYSGNTEETLAAVREAEKRKCRIVAVTAGGKLGELAQAGNRPLYRLPAGYQPRAALGYLLPPLLLALGQLGFYPTAAEELKETIALLRRQLAEIGPAVPQRANPAKQLAAKLLDKVPLVCGTRATTEAAALRWKTQLNENSKATTLLALFPELDHNEIVNLAALDKGKHQLAAVLLRSESDHERMKKRIEITKSLVGGPLGGWTEVPSQGRGRLARIMSLVFFGDLVSVYLALLKGRDPSEIEVINKLKKELSR